MTATMQLTAEGCAATFDPADGGRLTSFRVGDHELLVAKGKRHLPLGSFVMAPWVGRLRDARLNYGGAQYRFPANSGPHALHGLVTDRPWQVTGDGELSIELGDPWPWPCRVVQRTRAQPAVERRSGSKCMRAKPCRRLSAGILGSSAASPERRPPPSLDVRPGVDVGQRRHGPSERGA